MGDTGFELPQENTGKTRFFDSGGAESGAVGARDDDLARLVGVWPKLSAEDRVAVMDIVERYA